MGSAVASRFSLRGVPHRLASAGPRISRLPIPRRYRRSNSNNRAIATPTAPHDVSNTPAAAQSLTIRISGVDIGMQAVCQALDRRVEQFRRQHRAAGKYGDCPPMRRGAQGSECNKDRQERQGLYAQTSLATQSMRDACTRET